MKIRPLASLGLVLALCTTLPLSAQVVRDGPRAQALPSLGEGTGMSLSAERRLGDRIATRIYRDPDYLDDPVVGDYLEALWRPLMTAARQRGEITPEQSERLAWELMISRERAVNAFALPGGYLGVNLGLLALTERPEEVASVLAHELSHVSQRHISRLIENDERMAPWMLGAMILGALAAGSNPQAAGAAIIGGSAVAAQNALNFSRDMEREADRIGFGVLTEAGFDGQGFVTMFDKLQQASRLNDDGAFPYLRSHPLTGERIADMRLRLPVGPLASAAPRPGQPSMAFHAQVSARAKVMSEKSPDRWRALLANGQAADAGIGPRYAAALSALRLGQRDRAIELAEQLRRQVPADGRPWADALLLEILLAPGQLSPNHTPRLAELRDAALAGGSRSAVLLGAQAALATGEPGKAAGRLQEWVVSRPRDAQAWQLLSRAHQAQGQVLRSVRADAEARAAQRDFSGALERLKAAQALPPAQRNADPIELAIVDSRRRDVELLLKESMRED
ncbi:M48 family metalloprotease [Hydrogenophaga sp. R2]|uniref:M48 family metalloprotease n=1 Tax=Hydrogenophaga sp. R2 TaxID=3132827 RepID=UPI003CE8D3B4